MSDTAPRSPSEILNDFDNVHLNPIPLVHEVIADIRSSYRLALEEHLSADDITKVETEINDYVGNHYPDY